jgi:hypothetical protein
MTSRVLIALPPSLAAANLVVSGFVANAVPIDLLWRPLLIALGVALIIQLAISAWLGPIRGSFWAFVIASAMFGMFLIAGAMLLAAALFGFVRSRPGHEYTMAGLVAVAVSGSMFMAFAVMGVQQSAFTWTAPAGEPISLQDGGGGPNIHLLLLDGYPRQDTLAAAGMDNTPFLDAMRERGFDVYSDSVSNYDRTPFSILSILSGRHVEDIESLWTSPIPATTPQQERLTARMLLDPPMFDALEAAGYRTRALTGTVVHVPIGGADQEWSAGTANNFELDTLQRTPFAGLLELAGFAVGQQTAHIERTLDEFAAVVSDGRTFTFAHVVGPHAPYVFEADGRPASHPPCYPETCAIFDSDVSRLGWTADEYWRRYTANVEHLNALVVAAVDRLVDADPHGVIVIFSDHGVRFGDDPDSIFRNLLIARTPGHSGLFEPHQTPINMLPAVLDAYLGADLPMQPDSVYRGGDDPWLHVEQVTLSGEGP